jgi:hypothetical protein
MRFKPAFLSSAVVVAGMFVASAAYSQNLSAASSKIRLGEAISPDCGLFFLEKYPSAMALDITRIPTGGVSVGQSIQGTDGAFLRMEAYRPSQLKPAIIKINGLTMRTYEKSLDGNDVFMPSEIFFSSENGPRVVAAKYGHQGSKTEIGVFDDNQEDGAALMARYKRREMRSIMEACDIRPQDAPHP